MNDVRSLVALLPESLKQDFFTVTLAEAFERELTEAYAEALAYSDLQHPENLPEIILDILATERHVDYYSVSLPIEVKIELIRTSYLLHRQKGTPFAIERVLEAFQLNGEVLEWWQYDSTPYHFNVELGIDNQFSSLNEVRNLIMTYKNRRSRFDDFVFLFGDDRFLHRDVSYTYPIFLPYCNEVVGEADFTLFKDILEHEDQTYGYPVEYSVQEVFVTTSLNPVSQRDVSYSYVVDYPACGKMLTIDAFVHHESQEQRIEPFDYYYETNWLICGEFECGEELP